MKKMMAFLLCAAVMAALCGTAMAGAEGIAFTGKVTGGKLHMRVEPDSGAAIASTLKNGAQVEVLENDGVWCRVKAGSKEGYVMAEYLTITAEYPHIGWAKTARDGTILTLRKGPEKGNGVETQYWSGIVAEVMEEQGEWSRVRVGSTTGYVDAAALQKADIAPTADFTAGQDKFNLSAFSGKKEWGTQKTMERETGLPFRIVFPGLSIPEADAKIDGFIKDALALFERDYAENHAGETGKFTLDYQAHEIDARYKSVVLAGEYKAGKTTLHTFLCLNVDIQDGRVIALRDLFPDDTRLRYALEGQICGLMPAPVNGYDGAYTPDMLEHAVMTAEGLCFYFPAGLYLPAALGCQALTVPYTQVAESMRVDSEKIKSHRRVIDPEKPMIALTFDDGPSEETDRILSVLAKYDARATFCVQGMNVERFPATVKRAVALGNEIASHTWNHPKLTEKSAKTIRTQLERTSDIVREVTSGYEIKALRPPYGSYNKNVKTICREMGMVIVTWQVDTEDWSTRSASKTYQAIMKGARTSGVIILCHDLYSSTASAVEKAVPELVEKGIQLVTVSELLSFHKDGAQPGAVYSRLDPENIKK